MRARTWSSNSTNEEKCGSQPGGVSQSGAKGSRAETTEWVWWATTSVGPRTSLADGNIFVADGFAKFDQYGAFIALSPNATAPYHPDRRRGQRDVGDRGNSRIQVFDNDGNFKYVIDGMRFAMGHQHHPRTPSVCGTCSGSSCTGNLDNGEIYKASWVSSVGPAVCWESSPRLMRSTVGTRTSSTWVRSLESAEDHSTPSLFQPEATPCWALAKPAERGGTKKGGTAT